MYLQCLDFILGSKDTLKKLFVTEVCILLLMP